MNKKTKRLIIELTLIAVYIITTAYVLTQIINA